MKLYHSLIVACLLSVGACSKPFPRVDPSGKIFPDVRGERLSGETVAIPEDIEGRPAIVLVGYEQDAQFDIDRWILGLVQLRTPATLVEIPTIQGMVPSLIRSRINDGMRSGIPEEDWSAVVTVYDDAQKIASFTGTKKPLNARVLLLDEENKVLWFSDRGYSATLVSELDSIVRVQLSSVQSPTSLSQPQAASEDSK